MTVNRPDSDGSGRSLDIFSGGIAGLIFRFGALALIDAFALWFINQLLGNDAIFIAITVIIITIGLNAIFLVDRLYPFRWLSPGLALMVLMVIYPTIITVYYAFTNFSTGNLLRQNAAIEQIEVKPEYRFLVEGEEYYNQISYGAPENVYPDSFDLSNNPNRYVLWLQGRDTGAILIAEQEGDVIPLVDLLAEGEIFTVDGYEFANTETITESLADTDELTYGDPLTIVAVGEVDLAAEEGEGYIYDPLRSVLADYTRNRPTIFKAYAFQNDAGDVALWLIDEDETLLAVPGQDVIEGEIPETILGFTRLANNQRTRSIVTQGQPDLIFGSPENPIRVDSNSSSRAGRFQSRYMYDESSSEMVDVITNARYEAIEGTFTLIEGTATQDPPEDLELLQELSPRIFCPNRFR